MLNPDVREILDDPELGGGVSFEVIRIRNIRTGGHVTQEAVTYTATGNVQPEGKNTQASTSEDLLSESIVIYTTFIFNTGENDYSEFTGPDEVVHNGKHYRVTSVNDWNDWGFTIAHAERVRG